MCILKNNACLKLFFIFILPVFACKENNRSAQIKKNTYSVNDLTKTKAWNGISNYINKYADKSKVFRLQVINDDQASRIQINYLLKQSDITKRPPLYYINIDSALILVYNGLEEFISDSSSLIKLSNEPIFNRLKPEEKDSFLIYHPIVWEFIIDENKEVIVDTAATPFNYIRIKEFTPPPID